MRERTKLKVGSAEFLLLLIFAAFFGAYSGTSLQEHRYQEAKADQAASQEASASPASNGDVAPAHQYDQNEEEKTRFERLIDSSIDDLFLILFTAALVWVGALQYLQLRRTNDHSEIIERPYIYVSGVERLVVNRGLAGGFTPHILYHVANRGKTPATIENIKAALIVSKGIPNPTSSEDDALFPHRLLRNPTVKPDARRKDIRADVPAIGRYPNPSGDEICAEFDDPDDRLYFRILIRYRGPLRSGYETSGCWELDVNHNRFRECGGHKYNYNK